MKCNIETFRQAAWRCSRISRKQCCSRLEVVFFLLIISSCESQWLVVDMIIISSSVAHVNCCQGQSCQDAPSVWVHTQVLPVNPWQPCCQICQHIEINVNNMSSRYGSSSYWQMMMCSLIFNSVLYCVGFLIIESGRWLQTELPVEN
jgi:uncharacterized membrane protein YhaH (DUF805 family)